MQDFVIPLLGVSVLLTSITGYLRGKDIENLEKRVRKLEEKNHD